MSVTLTSVERINILKQGIESVTGESYENLTEAVQALKNGYGSAGESGSDDSADFMGVKYSNIDPDTKLPTIADARSLDGKGLRPDRMVYGLFWNYSNTSNGGFNVSLEEVYLPEECTNLSNTFVNCVSLQVVHGNLENVDTLFATFDKCSTLAEMPYMPNLTSIGSNSFRNCISLASIKFYKKPTTFNANALTGCTNLTDIYVPWAEGEVANAPWGAPNENLVIHYNTTYDENHNPIVSE